MEVWLYYVYNIHISTLNGDIIGVQCLCGELLDQTYPVDAYPGLYKTVVKCHNCLKKCPSNVLIYHCPKGKIVKHPYIYYKHNSNHIFIHACKHI